MKSPSFFCVCVKVLLFVGDLLFKGFVKILVPPLPGHLLQMGMGIHLIINTFITKNIKFILFFFLTKILTPLSHFDGWPFSSTSAIGTDSNPPSVCLKVFFAEHLPIWKFLLNTCQFESFYWTLPFWFLFTELPIWKKFFLGRFGVFCNSGERFLAYQRTIIIILKIPVSC